MKQMHGMSKSVGQGFDPRRFAQQKVLPVFDLVCAPRKPVAHQTAHRVFRMALAPSGFCAILHVCAPQSAEAMAGGGLRIAK